MQLANAKAGHPGGALSPPVFFVRRLSQNVPFAPTSNRWTVADPTGGPASRVTR